MLEENSKLYRKLIAQVKPVLVRRYGRQGTAELLQKTYTIYHKFLAETPSIGGKKNFMSDSLDLAVPFFALYEASGRSLTEAEITEMLEIVMLSKYRKLGRFLDMNKLDRPWLTRAAYRGVENVAQKINANKGGAWNNTWGIQINPEGHDHGLAFTLVGCPIADFAKAHGYMDVLPLLCRADIASAEAVHARLIRHHTVAQGYDTCDYWYVGDKDAGDVL